MQKCPKCGYNQNSKEALADSLRFAAGGCFFGFVLFEILDIYFVLTTPHTVLSPDILVLLGAGVIFGGAEYLLSKKQNKE